MRDKLRVKVMCILGILLLSALSAGCTPDEGKWKINLTSAPVPEATMPSLSPEELNSKADSIADYIISLSNAETTRIKDENEYINSVVSSALSEQETTKTLEE